MNNYHEGEFCSNKSSFFPKKSYNKIVNMNLLNSKEFMRNNMLVSPKDDNTKNELNDFIKRSMKFYSTLFISKNINYS